MSIRDRLRNAGTAVREAIQARQSRPHIDGPEALALARSAFVLGMEYQRAIADGKLTPKEALYLAELAQEFGLDVQEDLRD